MMNRGYNEEKAMAGLRLFSDPNACFLYGKCDGLSRFSPIGSKFEFVVNLVYATVMLNNEANREKLQRLAKENSDVNLVLQLRDRKTRKVKFQTY